VAKAGRVVAVLLGAAAVPAGPGVAVADSGHAGDVAAALQSDPVYVAPSRSERLDLAATGRIRLAILRKDIGRIHIAVVPRAWASESGGVGAFANAVDQELRGQGALLVVADRDAHVVTSHHHETAAATGVQRAFDRGGSLEARLRHSVEALAEVDPGDVRSDDIGTATPEITTVPDANRIVKDVDNTIKFTVVISLLAVLLPFVIVGVVLWLRSRRRREEDAEAFADALAAAKDERAALGDDIVDLDTPTSMPHVPAEVRAAYDRALDAYEKSEQALARANSRRRLQAATDLLAAGRRDAATARAAVGSPG
jgi:hypothetical protein